MLFKHQTWMNSCNCNVLILLRLVHIDSHNYKGTDMNNHHNFFQCFGFRFEEIVSKLVWTKQDIWGLHQQWKSLHPSLSLSHTPITLSTNHMTQIPMWPFKQSRYLQSLAPLPQLKTTSTWFQFRAETHKAHDTYESLFHVHPCHWNSTRSSVHWPC